MPQQLELAAANPSPAANLMGLKCMNPYVFLVGTPRSGTTMLKRMVNAHPLVAITRETHWVPRHFEKRSGVDAHGYITPDIVDALFAYYRFEQMKVTRADLVDFVGQNPVIPYAALVTFIFDRYGLRKHKPIIGDKTPCYLAKIPTLHQLWPAARFVHLIRDGRDVCMSMLNWRMAYKDVGRFSTWEIDPVVTIALWWKALVGIARQDGATLGSDQYLEVFYDAAVTSTERTCRSIAAFLQIDYDDAMVNYHVGRTQYSTAMSANAAWLPPTAGLRDWRTEMKSADQAKFEAAAGDFLSELGYETGSTLVSDSVRRHVADLRARFTSDADQRGWRLPARW